MVATGNSCKVFVLLEAFLTASYGFTMTMEYGQINGGFTLSDVLLSKLKQGQNRHLNYLSVHLYARHSLCRTFKGQQHFYKAMKTKACGISFSFTAELVIDLCQRKNQMLDKWVAELFDLDGDGYISHFERHFYVEDDYKLHGEGFKHLL